MFAVRGMELHKARRKPFRYPAWIDIGDGSALRDCMIYDISEIGARLTVADEEPIPDNFTLLLSRDGSARRICQTTSRSGFNIGIKFLRNPPLVKSNC
jgi:hypothetical protein